MLPAALLTVAPAWANTLPLTAESLRDDCRVYQEDVASPAAARCERYVIGFIHGVEARDGTGAVRAKPEERRESWIERATRSRLGRTQARTEPVRVVYCFDDPLPIAEIIVRIVDHIDSERASPATCAADAVRSVLREHYLCTPRGDTG
jgi:hypothetical protein